MANAVGYSSFIDLALFNGDLVTADLLGISEQQFFNGNIELENYFGYDWPDDAEPVTRADGQSFTFDIELFDSLGIANLNDFLAESLG